MSNQECKGDAARKKKSSNSENNIQLDSSPKSAEEDDMITLTKSQLQALLSASNTRGGFSPENQENENASVFGNIDTEAQEPFSKPNDNYLKAARNRENNPVAESAIAGNDAQNLLTTSSKASHVTQKMQWENEKRVYQEWNPWGRPGHGAPLERSVGVNGEIRHIRRPNATSNQTGGVGGVSKFNNAVNHGSSTPVARVLPKHQNPPELEQQREEQRQRKGKEREEISSSFGTPVSWKDNFEDSSAYRDMTSPTDPHENSRTYLLGQNTPVDPNVKKESDKKRLVATDYYRAVQAQVVEKERRKKEERLMQLKKEIEEEERFHKEQEEIKREFEMEQQRLKAKEESEQHRHKAIVEAMQRAKEEAEADKLARRQVRLQPNSAVNTTDDHDGIHVKTDRSSPATVPQFVEQSASVTNKGVFSCKGDGFQIPPNVTRSSNENNQEDSYVENRILTPTAYRYRNEDATDMTCSREFGTQTDNSRVIAKENVGDAEEGNKVKHGSKYRKLERPQWGVNKANVSEKDPNYNRKRNARKRRRMKSKVPADSTRSPTSSETQKQNDASSPKVQSADSGCADVGKHSESSSLDEQQRQATDQKNPITQPILMKGFPTLHHDRILQQLSDLRQDLLQKQIELQKLIGATKLLTTKSTYR